jgi:hypothetical protein
MISQKEFIPFISHEILAYFIYNKYITLKKVSIRKIEINISIILLNVWIISRDIDTDIYKIMLKKNIDISKFVNIRKNISNMWIHKKNKNSIYFISLKITAFFLTSEDINSVNVNSNVLQRSVIKILKYYISTTLKGQNLSEQNTPKGSLEWELFSSRVYFLKKLNKV